MNEKVKIEWLEKKNPDWKVANITKGDGTTVENVSINRTNTKGEVFPNFDAIMTGYTLECTVWTSGAGKTYLFAPKQAATGQNGASKGAGIAKAQEVKSQMIKGAQDNKELGIKTSSTIRMAVDLAIAECTNASTPDGISSSLEYQIKKWRKWLVANWDLEVTDTPPF